jgi:RimJ/RimL family protein N-acetyltransferase
LAFPERVETERLVLRRWTGGDREAWAAIWTDPAVWSALRPGLPIDRDFALERFEHHAAHWNEHGFGLWAAEDRASGQVAGWSGASHPTFVPELASEVEIGWSLRRPFWGRGLASEGAAAGIAAAFGHLDVPRVISLIARDNERSERVAAGLGLRHVSDVGESAAYGDLRVFALDRQAC